MREKSSRNTYIIFALICLIVFNIGTILIRTVGNKAKINPNYGVKPVFSYEESEIKDENFFIVFLGRTSSIINLYKNDKYSYNSWKDYLIENSSLANNFIKFMKAQFPSIIQLGNNSKPVVTDELGEDDMENPTIVEDFVIIDKLEEYEDLITIDDSGGEVSLENIPQPLNIKPLKVDKQKPYILLYHTHGTEAYMPIKQNQYHTTDRKYNVTTVGESMSKVLEAKGHKIEHVTEYHDIPSYNKSYSRSLNTVTQKLKDNSNYKILLDVHRDGYDIDISSNDKNVKKILAKSKTNINGKDVATFCFVVGPDNPNKEAILNFVKYIKAVSDVLYPGLCKGIIIKPVGKYNQFLSDYATLIEVGSNVNTMEEAMETSKILGEILDIVIKKIQQ